MTDVLLTNDFAYITKVKLEQDIDVIHIQHQYCKAKVSLYGGQVLGYQPVFNSTNESIVQENNQHDVFWLSNNASYQKGKAIRGGIPLCWPWFGANDNATVAISAMNHGFARTATWQIESISADTDTVTLVLTLDGENQHDLWLIAFKLKQTLVFGKIFEQDLAMTNLSKEDAQYSGALHSYFCVSNPKNITIDALTGVDYDDKLTDEITNQLESVSCVGPIDREYRIQHQYIQNRRAQGREEKSNAEQGDTVVMIDKEWQRKIEVTSYGCEQWVLWNPGVELADNMADIHVNGEQEFVCLEAANCTWKPLPAGETITLKQEITVSAL